MWLSVMKLTFWGAAGTVTGSMHMVETGTKRYLLDCGLYQGRRKEADAKNRHLPVAGESVAAVVLSHAHMDHSGNLPTLVKDGFSGPIFSTPASIDLCAWMLRDSAHIQEKDAEFVNKRREHRKALGIENGIVHPLYEMQDVERTLPLFHAVGYHTPQELEPQLSYECYDAGHILGSSFVRLTDTSARAPVRLLFSGDLGRPGLPILRDPEPMPPADYLILESTYGGRLHKSASHVINKLADVVNRTARRGGRIIVPAFAVGRTQQLVLLLHQLANDRRIPNIPIFVDSPLALNVTAVHRASGVLQRRDPGLPGARRGPLWIQALAVRAGRRRIQETERPARPVRGDFSFRNVRAGAHPTPPAEQYRGPPQHRLDHRLPGPGYAGAEAGGEVARSKDLRRAHARAGGDFQPGRIERPRRPAGASGVGAAAGRRVAQGVPGAW